MSALSRHNREVLQKVFVSVWGIQDCYEIGMGLAQGDSGIKLFTLYLTK